MAGASTPPVTAAPAAGAASEGLQVKVTRIASIGKTVSVTLANRSVPRVRPSMKTTVARTSTCNLAPVPSSCCACCRADDGHCRFRTDRRHRRRADQHCAGGAQQQSMNIRRGFAIIETLVSC